MARPRKFDTDIALERAMQAFWAKGYKATSLDDLCVATGLSRSSLYSAFGGKRALLHRSLERYEQQAVARVTASLSRPLPVREAVAGFVAELIDRIVAGPGRSGCFIGNCAGELARHDQATASRVRQSMQKIENIFETAIVKAQSHGELDTVADTASIARFLVAGIQGLRLVGKANPDRVVLESVAGMLLACLQTKESST